MEHQGGSCEGKVGVERVVGLCSPVDESRWTNRGLEGGELGMRKARRCGGLRSERGGGGGKWQHEMNTLRERERERMITWRRASPVGEAGVQQWGRRYGRSLERGRGRGAAVGKLDQER